MIFTREMRMSRSPMLRTGTDISEFVPAAISPKSTPSGGTERFPADAAITALAAKHRMAFAGFMFLDRIYRIDMITRPLDYIFLFRTS